MYIAVRKQNKHDNFGDSVLLQKTDKNEQSRVQVANYVKDYEEYCRLVLKTS